MRIKNLKKYSRATRYKYKRQAINAVLAVGVRRLLVQILQTFSNIILARILFPEDFGIFTIVITVTSMFLLLSDVGLQGAIIQVAKMPKTSMLRSIFLIHLLLGLVMTGTLWLAAPFLVNFNPQLFTAQGVFYLRLASISILLYNLRLIPAALVERELAYQKLVSIEVSEVFVTQGTTVLLAGSGWGVISYFWGLLAGRMIALVIFYSLRPWPVGINIKIPELKPLLKFGISYQVHLVIGMVAGAAAPVIIGTLAGPAALGLVVWAGGVTATALIVSEVVSRVIFAVGSRIQSEVKLVGSAIERGILFTNVLAFPVNLLLLGLAEPLTRIVYTEKWLTGLPLFYIFSLATAVSIFNSVLQNALLALGEVKIVRNISFLRMVALWVLAAMFVYRWGVTGFAWASVAVSTTSIFLWYVLRTRVVFRLWIYTVPYFLFSTIAGSLVYGLTKLIAVQNLWQLGLLGITGLVCYAILVRAFAFAALRENIRVIRELF